MIDPAAASALILVAALVLFVTERVRHDLIALFALLASLAIGLVKPADAFAGFGDPAVIAVAAVLVVGRALELSGAAALVAQRAMPARAGFGVRISVLLVLAAALSAFMNNIAALVICMPIAIEIARSARCSPSMVLMPLAFATILGGMTTLIGTPANLILSSVREKHTGEPFGFFAMTPVGAAVAGLGLVYLIVLGMRLLPDRKPEGAFGRKAWRVFELELDEATAADRVMAGLRRAGARPLRAWSPAGELIREGLPGARIAVLSRRNPDEVAEACGLPLRTTTEGDHASTAWVAVAHGSSLIGTGYDAINFQSGGRVHFVAAGPRMAREALPLDLATVRAGDQIFVGGHPADLAKFAARARLLEIDRADRLPIDGRTALAVVGIFIAAIVATVGLGCPPAISFLAAAALIAALRLIPPTEAYAAIDWSIIVLLAAMIPVGASFEASGAAAKVAGFMGEALAGQPSALAIAALCATTMILSIFLNNVATAVIMGPLAYRLADILSIDPDAMLLAVLIGASSDFLTPIGHQNNLLVMGPGGYRFIDYARAGALLCVLVVATTAIVLSRTYG